MQDVKHISIYIDRSPAEVYVFASNPANLPRWAAGLASAKVKQVGDVWLAEAPFGKVKIKFAPTNSFGVMDHDVELESGVVVHNPMRLCPMVMVVNSYSPYCDNPVCRHNNSLKTHVRWKKICKL